MNEEPFYFPPVSEEESGQKLLQFLERRLGLPENLLHRWIRTGQIRLNGRRCKPFVRLASGDEVRLPPFAGTLAKQTRDPECGAELPLPSIIGEKDGMIVYSKPAGLPVHPGTGHKDSLSSRLASHYADASFKPVPCHRLDRDTSGVIMVAANFRALRSIQEAIKNGHVQKEYLAWVDGVWPYNHTGLLKHYLRKEGPKGNVRIRATYDKLPYSREAVSIIRPIKIMGGKSLLQIGLVTGRTHQIRSQLSAIGLPVTGDGKYGSGGKLMLHSMRITLPDGTSFECAPDWSADFAVTTLPPPLLTSIDLDSLPELPQPHKNLKGK